MPDTPQEMKIDVLDLQFTPAGQNAFVVRVLDSPVGSGGRHEFALPFTSQELAVVRGVARVDAAVVRRFGLQLYQAALGGDVRLLLLATLQGLQAAPSAAANRLLQVRLGLSETPALANLPWECLYVEELGRHLALMQQVSIVRHLDVRRRPHVGSVALPLQVLCVIAAPQDLAAVDAAGEWQRLQRSFAPLVAGGLVQLERLKAPTFAGLAARLQAEPVHILHFIGHGAFDAQANSGALVLEDEKQQGLAVSADQLAQVLSNHVALRLVVLNACLGAQSAADDASVGVAQRLVVGGTPAVAAMQFSVTDKAAAEFTSEFYGALGSGRSVDEAMQCARQAIYAQPNAVEWATPVLFAARGEPLRIVATRAELAVAPATGTPATGTPATGTQVEGPVSGAPAGSAGQRGGPRRWLLAAAAAGILVVGLAAAYGLSKSFGPTAPAAGITVTAEPSAPAAAAHTEVAVETAALSTAAPTSAPTIATGLQLAPPLVERRPITVGLAAPIDCVQAQVIETFRSALNGELAKTKLLDKRIRLEEVIEAVRDDAGARSFGDRYDVVVWGLCAPPAGGAGETLTVTATLPLVGDSWEEATAHRVAQPPEVALTVDSGQAALAGQALAAVLAYYGEDEIEHAAPMLDQVAGRIDVGQAGTEEQRVRFHWLAGNAWIEHPEYILGAFPQNRSVDYAYQASASMQYQAAISLTQTLSEVVNVAPQLAALYQNLGWMHYKAGSPLDVAEYAKAASEFKTAAGYGAASAGTLEGLAYSSLALGVEAKTVINLCEPLRVSGDSLLYRVCRAYAELGGSAESLDHIAELISAIVAAEPAYAPSEFLAATVACERDHDSGESLRHLDRYKVANRLMPRWDALGLEIESDRAASMYESLKAYPAACTGEDSPG